MKRIFLFIAAITLCTTVWSQDVLTVVYATSDDGFLNVRERPSTKSKILTKLWMLNHGLGRGVLRGQSGNWSKVSVGDTYGWAYTKYIGYQNWFENKGAPKLVAASEPTIIYTENYADADEGLPVFTKVSKGTILADQFEEDEEYYMLTTAHDYLFIKKKDAVIVK